MDIRLETDAAFPHHKNCKIKIFPDSRPRVRWANIMSTRMTSAEYIANNNQLYRIIGVERSIYMTPSYKSITFSYS